MGDFCPNLPAMKFSSRFSTIFYHERRDQFLRWMSGTVRKHERNAGKTGGCTTVGGTCIQDRRRARNRPLPVSGGPEAGLHRAILCPSGRLALAPNRRFRFWPDAWPTSPAALSGRRKASSFTKSPWHSNRDIDYPRRRDCVVGKGALRVACARGPLTGAVDGAVPVCAARLRKARRRSELSRNGGYR
jgi:hypothetical protein